MERVSYSQGRAAIEDGDIVFISKNRTFNSIVIRFFTKSNYSHVGIAFWMETGNQKRLMLAEAQVGTMRRVINLSAYEGIDLDVIKSPKNWSDISERSLSKLGDIKYGWTDVAYIGIREFLLKRMNINIPRREFSGEICSEYVARMLDLPKHNISPQILWEHLLELGNEIKVLIKA